MSRDHYKGVPKTRDAVITKDGSVVALGKDQTTSQLNVGTTFGDQLPERVIYVRVTGSDSNSGTDENSDAVRTIEKAIQLLNYHSPSQHQVIDCTGVDWTSPETKSLPAVMAGFARIRRDTSSDPANTLWSNSYPLTFRARPTVLRQIDPSSGGQSLNGWNRTLNGAEEDMVVDEYVGKFSLNVDNREENSVIVYNTTTTYLTIGGDEAGFSDRVICEQSSVWTLGSALPETGNYLSTLRPSRGRGGLQVAATCGVLFDGIKFKIPPSSSSYLSSVSVQSTGQDVCFRNCHFERLGITEGAGEVLLEYCTVTDKFKQYGGTLNATGTFFNDVNFECTTGHANQLRECWFEGCDPFGEPGNNGGSPSQEYAMESYYPFSLRGSTFRNATSVAVIMQGSGRFYLYDNHYESIGDDAIICSGAGFAWLDNQQAAADNIGGYGLVVQLGFQVVWSPFGTFVGDDGELLIGSDTTPRLFANIPLSDKAEAVPQFCSVFDTGSFYFY